MWVRSEGAFEAVVPLDLFHGVQDLMRSRLPKARTDAEMLHDLRALFEREQKLNSKLIRAADGMACTAVYGQRFNGLPNAYRLVGYNSLHNVNRTSIYRVRQVAKRVRKQIIEGIEKGGGTVYYVARKMNVPMQRS